MLSVSGLASVAVGYWAAHSSHPVCVPCFVQCCLVFGLAPSLASSEVPAALVPERENTIVFEML